MMSSRTNTVSFFRGLAIVAIVLFHSAYNFDVGCIRKVLDFGIMGCQVFFTMSAYCLCASWNNRNEPVAQFYKRRFIALASGYWLTYFFYFLIDFISVRTTGSSLMHPNVSPLSLVANILLLNGAVPSYRIVCGVFPGGWFVGTLALMYLLFPLLHKLYYIENTRWEKHRLWFFPVAIIAFCSSVMILSGLHNETFCEPGNVKYFSIINQLPAFCLGFTLYEIKSRLPLSGKVSFPIGLLAFMITALFFYGGFKSSFVFAPTFMGLATVFLFFYFDGRIAVDKKIGSFVCSLGNNSYAVFLSHFWITEAAVVIVLRCIGFSGEHIPMPIYYVSLPLMLLLIYYMSIAYQYLIIKFKAFLSKVF